MPTYSRPVSAPVLLFIACSVLAIPAAAQETASAKQQVVSANPFGLLLELVNAEYERVVSPSSTAGLGGSAYFGNDDYVNADAFWRYYPQGRPLQGWAFGVKAGVTQVPSDGTYLGAGFDLNHSWLMGRDDNFYVGIGFGLKRLFGSNDSGFDLEYIPTIRIINVGWAF